MSAKEKKKIFIGIKISLDIQQKISDWKKSFSFLPVRWIKGEDLHITLIPPWIEKDIEEIEERLKNFAKKVANFQIEIDKIIYAPTDKKPTLIWAETVPFPEISRLKKGLEDALGKDKASSFPVFRPHITIARFNSKDFKSFPAKKLDKKISWKEIFEKITIFESPTGNDSGYKTICEIPLGGKARKE